MELSITEISDLYLNGTISKDTTEKVLNQFTKEDLIQELMVSSDNYDDDEISIEDSDNKDNTDDKEEQEYDDIEEDIDDTDDEEEIEKVSSNTPSPPRPPSPPGFKPSSKDLDANSDDDIEDDDYIEDDDLLG